MANDIVSIKVFADADVLALNCKDERWALNKLTENMAESPLRTAIMQRAHLLARIEDACRALVVAEQQHWPGGPQNRVGQPGNPDGLLGTTEGE